MPRSSGPLAALLAGLLLLLLARPAAATTVAVLPLAKGSGSEAYDGLGQALAGMLVSDLSTAEALTLVERDRLDALMSELALADSGFLDPATAQRLGRGLGAEVVLTGSFSVVERSFLLDARLVRVESGQVLKAADSQGTIDDFVAVEKALVEELLAGLQVALDAGARRRLMLQAPTERFGAFAAFGEGLARQGEGDLEAARAAFERAVAQDPAFEEARAALVQLQGLLEAARAEQRLVADALLDARYRAAIAATVDERTRPPGFRHDATSVGDLMLRQSVLADAGLHCQRAEELRAFLRHVGWDLALPQNGWAEQVHLRERMAALQLDQQDVWEARRRLGLSSRPDPAAPFESTTDLLLDSRTAYIGRSGAGLVESLEACLEPEALLAELDSLVAEARAAGQAGRRDGRPGQLTLEEHLTLLWAWLRARELGADAELNRRTEALLAGARDEDHRDALLAVLEVIVREADETSAYQAGTLGQGEARLEEVLTALSERRSDFFRADSQSCRWLFDNQLGQARSWVVALRGYQAETEPARRRNLLRLHYRMAGQVFGPLRDLGCLADTPGRFSGWSDTAAALAGVTLLPGKEDEGSCVQMQANLERSLSQPMANPEAFAQSPELEGAMTWGALVMYYALVNQRCVPLPER